MAILTNTGLETAPTGTLNKLAIINANFARIDELFSAALDSGDPQFGWVETLLGEQAAMETIAYDGTDTVSFKGRRMKFLSLTGNSVITWADKHDGRSIFLILKTDGTARTVTWPGGMVWSGDAVTTIPASTTYIVLLYSTGPNDADVVGAKLGSKTGRQTIWIPAGAMTARTTNGAATGSVETTTNKVMLPTLDFDTSTQEFAQFSVQMPKSWNAGTVTARFLWKHAATTTNFGVCWGLQGLALSDDDAADAAFGTAAEVTDTGGTTNDLYRTSETSAITIAGSPAVGDNIIFQVYRKPADAGDTLAIDAGLLGVELFYTANAATDD